MFDILMYLFETYVHSDMDLYFDRDELSEELSRAGFGQRDISKAVHWVEQLTKLQDSEAEDFIYTFTSSGSRTYAALECDKIGLETRNYLMFLERIQILNAVSREMVIDKIIALEGECLSVDDSKWVILMVLFNADGCETAYQKMEDLIYEDEPNPTLH